MMKENKLLSVALSILTALLVLSGSVAVPLLCRPFYYAHITAFNLESYGLSFGQIKLAYDEMMDFCLGLRPDFAAGPLIWSRSGMEHFADVRKLFLLDLWVLGLGILLLMVLFLVCRKKKLRPYCFRGRGPGFWGAVGLAVVFVVIGGLASLDFDRAFVVFHSLFFPGKTNWLFDWRTDPIILLLPQEFFRNCALLIFGLILVWCAALIGSDLWAGKRREQLRKQAKQTPMMQSPCSGCPGAAGDNPRLCNGCPGAAPKPEDEKRG